MRIMGQHLVHDSLEGHGVATESPGGEKMTPATPIAGVKLDFVYVVVALKRAFQAGDGDPIPFLRVSPGFINLPDNAGVHQHPPWTITRRFDFTVIPDMGQGIPA